MRAAGGISPLGTPGGRGNAWLVTRMEEAVQILKDRRFTVDASVVDPGRGTFGQSMSAMNAAPTFLSGRTMVSVDEPDHSRLRGLVSKAFTPRFIEGLRPHIQDIADELLNRAQPKGEMDLVHDYAYPLPINVISDMLGVPRENRGRIREWSDMLAGGSPTDRGASGASGVAKYQAFADYVVQLISDKRRHPQDDLISQLIQIEEAGDHLSQDELIAMVSLLIFAGHETTSNLIGTGMLMLLDNPEQLAKLKADLSLVPPTVEELLRYNGPVTTPAPRFAIEDVEMDGKTIRRGDMVMVALAAANRDERQFTNPDELDIARSLNRHIAFGQGIHYCLGAPLARLEGEIAFTTLLRRMPNIHLNASRDTITWRDSFSLRGLKSLPVAF
jgi:cytochrome P450